MHVSGKVENPSVDTVFIVKQDLCLAIKKNGNV